MSILFVQNTITISDIYKAVEQDRWAQLGTECALAAAAGN